jgi:hypothetical protein
MESDAGTALKRADMSLTYLIQGEKTGLTKIGQSKNPTARLYMLQVGSPDRLTLLCAVESPSEKELHERWKRHRAYGEWFFPHEDLLSFAAAHPRPNARPPKSHGNTLNSRKVKEALGQITDIETRRRIAEVLFGWT